MPSQAPQGIRPFVRAVLWGLRSWRAGDRLLRGGPEAFEASGYDVEDFLNGPLWYLRNIGVKMVAKFQLQDRYPVLLERLADRREAPILRRNCAQALGQIAIAAEEAQAALLGALKDPYWEVRTEALGSLLATQPPSERITGEVVRSLFGELAPPPPGPGRPGPARPNEKVFEVRAAAAKVLARLGVPPVAFEGLRALAADENWIVRTQAVAALAEFGIRNADFRDDAQRLIREVNPVSDAMVPWFVPRSRSRRAMEEISQPAEVVRNEHFDSLYLDLKKGWHA